jgi:hypothetical protein
VEISRLVGDNTGNLSSVGCKSSRLANEVIERSRMLGAKEEGMFVTRR